MEVQEPKQTGKMATGANETDERCSYYGNASYLENI